MDSGYTQPGPDTLHEDAERLQKQGWIEWPEPEPLIVTLKPVEPFNEKLLPDSIAPWVADIATRMQCPLDFPAAGAMVALSGAIGCKVGIYPKRHDDWLVVANLWGMLVGRPSVLKTPALEQSLIPLTRLEIAAKEKYEAKLRLFCAEAELATIRKDDAKVKAKKMIKDGNESGARSVLIEAEKRQPDAPVRRRYLVNDCTIEKLGELLNENPDGLLLKRDEMSGFLRSLDREDRKADRAFYLEAFNGTGRYTYDRIGRGTIDIDATTLSLIGTIQPGVLRPYIAGAIAGGIGEDGLIQRMQLMIYPDVPSEWKYVDQWPDKDAKDKAFKVFEGLTKYSPPNPDESSIPALRFSADAQSLFVEWLTELESSMRNDDMHPSIESHLAKYRSLIPSLALIIQLADDAAARSVGDLAFMKACAWGEYLRSHAERIYGSATDSDTVNAQTVLDKIAGGKLKDQFTSRDVQRGGWSGLTDNERVKQALNVLCDHRYLMEETIETGGRPSTRYAINPNFYPKNGPPKH